MKYLNLLAMFIIALINNSCSSISVTSSWRAPDFVPPAYNKVIVVGIFRGADVQLQSQMEAHLVDDLKSNGLNAYSAYQEYGPKAFYNMDEQQIKAKLSKEGVDAVVTIVLLDKQLEKYYTPGRIVYSPYILYHNYFHGYYRSIYTRIETPGYYQTLTKYFWESNLYDIRTDKLVFSIQTQSFDPQSTNSLAHEYGQLIVQHMIKNNALPLNKIAAPKTM